MEKLTEASSQFMAMSNSLQQHAMKIEGQRALDFHQPPPPQEEKINLEDVFTRLDETTKQFVSQQQAMMIPSQEVSFQNLEVETNFATIQVEGGKILDELSSNLNPQRLQGQWTQEPSLQEVEEMRVEEKMETSWDKEEQVVIEEETKREDIPPPLLVISPPPQDLQDTSSWRIIENRRNNQEMLNHLGDYVKTWLMEVAESLGEIVVNLAHRLKAPYAFIVPKSIVELRRHDPP